LYASFFPWLSSNGANSIIKAQLGDFKILTVQWPGSIFFGKGVATQNESGSDVVEGGAHVESGRGEFYTLGDSAGGQFRKQPHP
jgi:hypothetical protein